MKQIWAPWRIEYIKQSQKAKLKTGRKGCFLCLNSSKSDGKNLILLRGKYAFVIMNRFPYNPGHLMIAPYRHIRTIEQCRAEEAGELFQLLKHCISALKMVMKPEGFNIGVNIGNVAGAGVPGHLHIHIIPRWLGDTNFMPIIGEIKIINEELHKMYRKVKKELISTRK